MKFDVTVTGGMKTLTAWEKVQVARQMKERLCAEPYHIDAGDGTGPRSLTLDNVEFDHINLDLWMA
jgi:hypothetical protein